MNTTGQALAYVYARETKTDADTAKMLTMDEAQRVLHHTLNNVTRRSSPVAGQGMR